MSLFSIVNTELKTLGWIPPNIGIIGLETKLDSLVFLFNAIVIDLGNYLHDIGFNIPTDTEERRLKVITSAIGFMQRLSEERKDKQIN